MVSGQQQAPAAFYPRERPGTHFTGGLVDPQIPSGRAENLFPYRDSIPDRPAPSQLSYPARTIYNNLQKVVPSYFLSLSFLTSILFFKDNMLLFPCRKQNILEAIKAINYDEDPFFLI